MTQQKYNDKPFEVFTCGGHFVGRYATEEEANRVMNGGKMVLRVSGHPKVVDLAAFMRA